MNEKTKPFDGVKMGKTKPREYKIGNKKLKGGLKNIKMFEEFSEEIEAGETEEVEEGLFSKSKEEKKKELEADFKKYEIAWGKKGFKIYQFHLWREYEPEW